jgi:hypothetical protein
VRRLAKSTVSGSFLMLRFAVALGLLLAAASAWSAETVKPIVEIKDVQPEPSVFRAAKRGEPLVLKSADDLAKHFSKESAEKLLAQLDLEKQFVLLFAWRGSGQDRLSYEVLESFPEQIVFELTPGRTRDLRPHVHIFALRNNVRWKVK